MKEYTFTFTNSLSTAITVEAKNGDVAFEKAIKELKKELEDSCYSGDLEETT